MTSRSSTPSGFVEIDEVAVRRCAELSGPSSGFAKALKDAEEIRARGNIARVLVNWETGEVCAQEGVIANG